MESLPLDDTDSKRDEHTNSSDGAPLSALVVGAPHGLSIAGDLAALDSLDVNELARIARRAGQ